MTQNPTETDLAEAETEHAQQALWDIITHQGTRAAAVSKYKDKLVKLMDKLVDVSKNAHTLELEGNILEENIVFTNDLLGAVDAVQE